MVTTNLVQVKSFAFDVRIIQLAKYLAEEKKEFVLSKQVLRSGTSIGANIGEAIEEQSEKDFLEKLTISYKEASEIQYFLRLLNVTSYIDKVSRNL
jgi:four helix bundle protein